MGTLDVMQFREEDARALKIYFEDFDEKYRVYEKMIEQIGLFKKIVDERFYSNIWRLQMDRIWQ